MSSRSQLYDRATNIKFTRIGSDFKGTYRLFELHLGSNFSVFYDNYARWHLFDHTLRDLFEMPNARFWNSIINCMQNQGVAYAFVPLNATSVTANISAMAVLSRPTNATDHIYVCYMATRKEYRRQGLGTYLLQQTVRRALAERRNGVKYVSLHVNTLNTAAIELYERCGWRCFQYLPSYLEPDPHHATNHAYGLILHLHSVKNATGLCRDPNAIDRKLLDDKKSIENCNRVPIKGLK